MKWNIPFQWRIQGRGKALSSQNSPFIVKASKALGMPDSLYGARLQGFTVAVFIVAKSRAWFDEYIYHDSLQARAIGGIGHSGPDCG